MRMVILGSGQGSNARAILECWKADKLGKAVPVAILSDVPDAGILKLGREFGIDAEYVEPGPRRTVLTPDAEQRYISRIGACEPELLVLAGFMRVVKAPFLKAFSGRIINLHPSLLPSFKGLDGIGQAWRYGVKVTGCTVHFVTADLDGGPIIDQVAVRVDAEDTQETLARKIHAAEHLLLPAVIRRLAAGEIPPPHPAT